MISKIGAVMTNFSQLTCPDNRFHSAQREMNRLGMIRWLCCFQWRSTAVATVVEHYKVVPVFRSKLSFVCAELDATAEFPLVAFLLKYHCTLTMPLQRMNGSNGS